MQEEALQQRSRKRKKLMRKLVCKLAITMAVTGGLALPHSASAVTYEDSFSNCNYPKTFDLMVMRPISLATIGLGAALYLPLGPLGFATAPQDAGVVFNNLIGKPTRFTFKRDLGECQAVSLDL